MQSERQERIRERAYQIWLAEGRVHGRHHDHWQRAEQDIAAEEGKASGGARPRHSRAAAKPTSAAEATPAAASKARAKSESTVEKPRSAARPAGTATTGRRRSTAKPAQ